MFGYENMIKFCQIYLKISKLSLKINFVPFYSNDNKLNYRHNPNHQLHKSTKNTIHLVINNIIICEVIHFIQKYQLKLNVFLFCDIAQN